MNKRNSFNKVYQIYRSTILGSSLLIQLKWYLIKSRYIASQDTYLMHYYIFSIYNDGFFAGIQDALHNIFSKLSLIKILLLIKCLLLLQLQEWLVLLWGRFGASEESEDNCASTRGSQRSCEKWKKQLDERRRSCTRDSNSYEGISQERSWIRINDGKRTTIERWICKERKEAVQKVEDTEKKTKLKKSFFRRITRAIRRLMWVFITIWKSIQVVLLKQQK